MSVPETEIKEKPRTCVVVCYWTGRPIRRLHKLLEQMKIFDAGSPFDLVIVCNGGDERPVTLPRRFDVLKPKILNRENTYFNLGAWDHGWRNSPGYEFYFFLQDDCFLRDVDWVYAFERRMDFDRGLGLLGELEFDAEFPWEVKWALAANHPPHDVEVRSIYDRAVSRFDELGLTLGPTARYIPTIIQFVRQEVLERVGGYRSFGPTFLDAIALETVFSHEIIARGYRIAKIYQAPFLLIGHEEWTPVGTMRRRFSWKPAAFRLLALHWLWRIKDALKPRLGMRLKSHKHHPHRPFPHPDVDPSQFPPPPEVGTTPSRPSAPALRPPPSEVRVSPSPKTPTQP